VIFIIYPSSLLFLASRRTSDPEVKRALILLPATWIGIGLVILIFNGYFLTIAKTDDSALAYLFAATLFSVSASIFRRATLLSGFFVQVPPPPVQPIALRERPFTSRLGIEPTQLAGKEVLIEVDPSSDYERAVRDLTTEFKADGYVTFVFTSNGSPIYRALSPDGGTRFFVLTERVTYPRAGIDEREMLVPRYDQSVLLSVIDKTIKSNFQLKLLIIFDDLTDMILSVGLESTYKFMKQANELLEAARTTAVFLLTMAAQGTRETNVVKSNFSEQFSYSLEGLRIVKAA